MDLPQWLLRMLYKLPWVMVREMIGNTLINNYLQKWHGDCYWKGVPPEVLGTH